MPFAGNCRDGSDHAQHPFPCRSEGGDFHCYSCYAQYSGSSAGTAGDRFSTADPGADLRSYLQINPLAAHTGTHLPSTCQALSTNYRLARRRHPMLDRAAGEARMMGGPGPKFAAARKTDQPFGGLGSQ